MMNRSVISLLVTLWGVAALPLFAQEKLTDLEILDAWLSSPHADSTSEAFRHWDTEGEIPGTCAVCHSTMGVIDYLSTPTTTPGIIGHSVPNGTTVECAACHNGNAEALDKVLYPNGLSVSTPSNSAICAVCHQGRSSMDKVDASVIDLDEDTVDPEIAFINIHYAAAASTQQGGAVRGGYQYEDRIYAGPFAHVVGLDTCVSCHDPHKTEVALESCTSCHAGVTEFRAIRTTHLDILMSGDTTKGIGIVVEGLHKELEAAIMVYAKEVAGSPIAYSKDAYPYFFSDLNEDGTAGSVEAIFHNRYQSWTPRLVKADYNYQFVAKDSGAFAHNPHYVIQLMIDSIENISEVAKIETTGFQRP